MQKYARLDGTGLSPARPVQSNRTPSLSSERTSVSGRVMLPPSPSTSLEPAYIAASAASQLVSMETDGDDMMVARPALALLNEFLDQILYSILATAKSTKLSFLRMSVPQVLKPKLGRAAVAGADEELGEYLGGADEEEPGDPDEDGEEITTEFDLALAWRLARLRCMVYTRLGDLEEEDEDAYLKREKLDVASGGPGHYENHPSRVTPAAAIFLTSVLEYLGELALHSAGQEAQNRIFMAKPSSSPTSGGERLIVEKVDMNKGQIGRNSPLQRLWRTWRKPVTREPLLRAASRESLGGRGISRASNHSGVTSFEDDDSQSRSVSQVLQPADFEDSEAPRTAPKPAEDGHHDLPSIPEQIERRRSSSMNLGQRGLDEETVTPVHRQITSPALPSATNDWGHSRSRSEPASQFSPVQSVAPPMPGAFSPNQIQ